MKKYLPVIVLFCVGCGSMTPARLQGESHEISRRAAENMANNMQKMLSTLEKCEAILNKAKDERLGAVQEFRREYPQYGEIARTFENVDKSHMETMTLFHSIREILVSSTEEALVLEREGNAQVQQISEFVKSAEVAKE